MATPASPYLSTTKRAPRSERHREAKEISMNNRRGCAISLPLFMAASLCGISPVGAQSTVLYYEDFTDAAINTMGTLNNGTIMDGTAVLDDSTTTGRASFVIRWPVEAPLDDDIMTFQVDFTQPIDPYVHEPVTRMEVIMRAGVGTNNNTMSSAEHVIESIAYRGDFDDAAPSRLPLNDGSETLFMVYNNKETALTFPSPVDGLDVTLPGYNYVPYVLNRTSNTFSALLQKGLSHFNPVADAVPRDIIKVGIGSSTNTDIGKFAIDNVLIRSGVLFDRNFPEVGGTPGDFDGSGIVDAADFALWVQRFGSSAPPLADGDNDGDTDGNDFLIWQRNLPPAAAATGAAVPEPASLFIAGLSIIATVGVRRARCLVIT
jgi:hypothetical protein